MWCIRYAVYPYVSIRITVIIGLCALCHACRNRNSNIWIIIRRMTIFSDLFFYHSMWPQYRMMENQHFDYIITNDIEYISIDIQNTISFACLIVSFFSNLTKIFPFHIWANCCLRFRNMHFVCALNELLGGDSGRLPIWAFICRT